jgi:hypothetical protein
MLVKLEHQERQKPPFLARQMLKWFYDTSIGTVTRAVRCDSFIREGIGLSDVSYGGTRWRRKIYVVQQSERNTLHPRENESCIVV